MISLLREQLSKYAKHDMVYRSVYSYPIKQQPNVTREKYGSVSII